MAICPIANSVGCEQCTIVKVCFLKSVLGNYDDERSGQEPEESKPTTPEPFD
ncbi:MAG: hypothetical protein HND53_06010 [Proteobacteria bacterium]|nr:hypothetical protein [Pseudomonadota bacterium]